jgi:hypothetical protein
MSRNCICVELSLNSHVTAGGDEKPPLNSEHVCACACVCVCSNKHEAVRLRETVLGPYGNEYL